MAEKPELEKVLKSLEKLSKSIEKFSKSLEEVSKGVAALSERLDIAMKRMDDFYRKIEDLERRRFLPPSFLEVERLRKRCHAVLRDEAYTHVVETKIPLKNLLKNTYCYENGAGNKVFEKVLEATRELAFRELGPHVMMAYKRIEKAAIEAKSYYGVGDLKLYPEGERRRFSLGDYLDTLTKVLRRVVEHELGKSPKLAKAIIGVSPIEESLISVESLIRAKEDVYMSIVMCLIPAMKEVYKYAGCEEMFYKIIERVIPKGTPAYEDIMEHLVGVEVE